MCKTRQPVWEKAGRLHFAAATLNMVGGADIGEFDDLLDDPASGLTIVNGSLEMRIAF